MRRKILYISGTRADYGLMRSVLYLIEHQSGMQLEIIATGMHLMHEFGYTVDQIRDDGYHCHIIDSTYTDDSKESMAKFIGCFIQSLVDQIKIISPDIILLLGDRGEILGAAIVGTYLGIPVAHIHGGEVTATVDEMARHAITKLSHIHFVATQESADRIIKMGENPANVFVVGAPGLDAIHQKKLPDLEEIVKRYKIDPSKQLILVLQHPVTLDDGDPCDSMKQTMMAVSEIHQQTLVIYPNADSGGRSMIEVIKKYESDPQIQTYQNIPHDDFLCLLKIASVIVGNSSSGIIEAPSFGLPAVNIGIRQKGRQRGENVIDVGNDKFEIKAAISKALNDDVFKKRVKESPNPYGNGTSSKKIVGILNKIKIDSDLLQKRLTY